MRDRVGALRVLEALDVELELLRVERLADVAPGEDVPRDPAVLEGALSEAGSRDHPRVPGAPGLKQEARRPAHEGVWGVAIDHPPDSLGVEDAEEHRRPAAPIVAEHVRPLDAERVQERDLVGGERLSVVALPRRFGPAEAA